MKAKKQAAGRGGARKGAGRKKKVGWKRRPLALRESTWGKLKRLAARRKKKGEANASMTEIADELIYFGLEPEKREELEAFAKERGCTVEQLIQQAVTEFLAEKRGN
jgi:predicted DNA-binding ribbon-helix-helix protein